MRRVAVLALTAFGLSACGPDDHAMDNRSATDASAAPLQDSPRRAGSAIEPLLTTLANDQAASTPAAAAEQSLAADTQQVAPVLHYPPDSAN